MNTIKKLCPNKKTFCVAPFMHGHVNTKGFLKVCCISQEQNKYKYSQIKKWFGSKELKQIRENLLNGIKDPICTACWDAEKAGKKSQRQIYNKYIGKILEDHWQKNFDKNKKIQEVLKNPTTCTNITSFDLALGNHCNLKCTMCSPNSSSQILIEVKNNQSLKKFYKDDTPDSKTFIWPKQNKFYNWCKRNFKNAVHLKFTGGEPLLNPFILKTLKEMPEKNKKNGRIEFVSNLTTINESILEQFKDWNEVWFMVSVDGTEKVFEYVRSGHSWSTLKNNLDLIIKKSKETKFVIVINYVVQNTTVFDVFNLLNFCDLRNIIIAPILLRNPDVFKLQAIKTQSKLDLIKQLEKYQGINKVFVQTLIEWTKINLNYDPILAKKLIERLEAHDYVRKTNYKNILQLDKYI